MIDLIPLPPTAWGDEQQDKKVYAVPSATAVKATSTSNGHTPCPLFPEWYFADNEVDLFDPIAKAIETDLGAWLWIKTEGEFYLYFPNGIWEKATEKIIGHVKKLLQTRHHDLKYRIYDATKKIAIHKKELSQLSEDDNEKTQLETTIEQLEKIVKETTITSKVNIPSSRLINNVVSALKIYNYMDALPLPIAGTMVTELGTIDLASGNTVANSADYYHTHLITAPAGRGNYGTWGEWLNTIGLSQEQLTALQVAMGYSITGIGTGGDGANHCLFYIYGAPRSGKGTFLGTIFRVIGNMGGSVSHALLTHNDTSGNNFEMATSSRKRLLWCDDLPDWQLSGKLKSLTGSSFLSASYKGKPHFTFCPQWAIWITSNNPPKIDPSDTASWSRLRLWEFPNSYTGLEDTSLMYRFDTANVLAWLIDGAIEFYRRDKRVYDNLDKELFETAVINSDPLRQWLAEVTVNQGTPKELYHGFTSWAYDNGYRTDKYTMNFFGRELKRLGATPKSNGTVRTWVLPNSTPATPPPLSPAVFGKVTS